MLELCARRRRLKEPGRELLEENAFAVASGSLPEPPAAMHVRGSFLNVVNDVFAEQKLRLAVATIALEVFQKAGDRFAALFFRLAALLLGGAGSGLALLLRRGFVIPIVVQQMRVARVDPGHGALVVAFGQATARFPARQPTFGPGQAPPMVQFGPLEGAALMQYALDRFAEQIRDALLATGLVADEQIELSEPKANISADLALPCFRAAKSAGVPPAQLAQKLADALRFPDDTLVGGWSAAGPFLNFVVHAERFARLVVAEVEAAGERYGSDDRGQNQTVIVEYSSPNVAKRMHVGHIRSTIIGQALNNLLAFGGYTTIADNHLGDYGKQFGTMIAAIERYGRPGGEGEEILTRLEQIYAEYNRLKGVPSSDDEWADPDKLDDEARAWSLRLEQNDQHARELWQWMVGATLEANARNYERLGVQFDTQHGESFYAGELPTVLSKVEELDVAERDAGGALAVKGLLEGKKELPSFLVQRSDGATLYLTRDLATVIYREAEYRPSKIIYVVEQRQELHFRQTFALVRALGYAHDIELVHVTFGTIFGANGQPLSTRKGNMVYLEALLDDARARARTVIETKIAEGKADLTLEQVDEVAESVGVGAVVYNDLYQDPKRNLTLDWERMLSFEGNSAPYIQYTHARCCSILREAGELPAVYDAALLAEEQEQAVVKQLARLPDAVRRAGDAYAPYIVAEWVYTLAREYARFYRDFSVLKAATPELRAARLHLTAATARGIRNALGLLGIRAPERM